MPTQTSYRRLIAQRAEKIARALAEVRGEFETLVQVGDVVLRSLTWNEDMRIRAEQARYNGGTAEVPISRRGVQGWVTDKHESRWQFDRFRFIALTPLAAGYLATGEEDYAQAARDYIGEWMLAHPEAMDDDGLNTAIRINLHGAQGWLGTLPYFLPSPAFNDAFIERIVEIARRDLNSLEPRFAHTANVRLFQADSLLWAGLRLPFLPEADHWCSMGVRMLNDAFFRMIAPDGSNVEKDPHYVGIYLDIYGEAPLWAKAFPELGLHVESEPVSRLFDYALCGTKPSGFECALHDSVSAWTGHRENLALKARREFRKRNGLNPDVLPPTSAYFPNAGQVFMRTGWGEDTQFMSFDATREGTAHNHLSINAVQLHAYGRSLLIDPGFLTYRMGHMKGDDLDEIAGPHGKSTRAHNTVNLNGWNQFFTSPEFCRHWHAPGYDAVVCRYHGGYWPGRYGWWFFEGGGNGLAAQHERILFWMHDRAAIVIDHLMRWHEPLAGDDHQQPSLELNWQFSPGPVTVDASNWCAFTGHDDGNVLMLFPLLADNMTMTVHEGEWEPPRGWVGDPNRDHKYSPAPQLVLESKPMPDYAQWLVSVLVPYQGSAMPAVTAEAIAPGQQAHASSNPGSLILQWGDGSTDTVFWMPSLGYALGEVEGIVTDASLVYLHSEAQGDQIEGVAVNGTYCTPYYADALSAPGVMAW